jgi:hypothetical protein
MPAQGFAVTEPRAFGHRFQATIRRCQLGLGSFRPQTRHKARRRGVHLLPEHPAEVALAHAGAPRQRSIA